MKTTFTQQIHDEHRYLLNLCDQLELCLDHINLEQVNHDHNYQECHELVDDLRYVLINVHHPKDRQLTDRIGQSDASKLWVGLLHNFHYPITLDTLNHFDNIIKSAARGSIVNKDVIYDQGLRSIQHLRLAIEFEEHVCLPYAVDDVIRSPVQPPVNKAHNDLH